MYKLSCCVAVAVAGLGGKAVAVIINVPGDQPTIQAAIDVAVNGDEVVVAVGTYNEQVNFLGKAITLRSSDGPEVTTITFTGQGQTLVSCISGEGPATLLQGFTITGAIGAGGAGMRNDASSPTVINCVFDSNALGMGNRNSSSPMVINCVFSMNSDPGMINQNGGSTTVANCVFFRNGRSGMINAAASPFVIGCQFIDNTTPGSEVGAGMRNLDSSPTVVNCLFAGNTSANTGGGMDNRGLNASSSPAIINCTFVGNSGFGGAMFNDDFATPTVVNSILWGNSVTQIFDNLAVTTLLYSDIEGGWFGLGSNNVDADPLFVDPANGDYRLQSGSPAIDAGNSWGTVDITDTDLDGNPRFADDPATVDTGCGVPVIVDMGAYEFQGTPATVKLGDIDADGAVAVPDLLTLLAAWGPTGGGCQLADFDLDGIVAMPDLLILLANWG